MIYRETSRVSSSSETSPIFMPVYFVMWLGVRASDQNIIDRKGLLMQIHLLLVLIMFYLRVSTLYKYDECSPAQCLRTTIFTDTRPQNPSYKFELLYVIIIRVIVDYLDHLLVTRSENSR